MAADVVWLGSFHVLIDREMQMSDPWYRDGLRFECTRCGNCCTGAPGAVWVNEAELNVIAELLGIPLDEATSLYTRLLHGKRTLREKSNNDCIFYERGAGCTIYSARPRQCRTWPFWESNLVSPSTWESMAENCPGADHGELIPVEEITRRMKVIRL